MALDQLFQEFQSNPVTIIILSVCVLSMLYYAILEWKSIETEDFKDYKSIIISIGICGTFIGICFSLFVFDSQNIEKSIPDLLGGLKLAFLTSIIGMFVSIVLSHKENSLSKLESQSHSSETKILKSILKTNTETNGVLIQISESMEKSNLKIIDQLVSTKSSILSCLKPILDEQKTTNNLFIAFKDKVEIINDNMLQSSENIDQHFNKIHISLKQALEELSKGATEVVVTALKQVIADFNNNLKEQFGSNFKQLNEAVYKMIEWQENYKLTIIQVEKSLQNIQAQIEYNSSWIENFSEDYKKISKVHQDLREIITTNQHQIESLENGLNSLHKAGKGAELVVKSMENFSSKIRSAIEEQSTALNNQSDSLRTQSENLKKELESSLGKLNTALVTLTNKFKDDYKNFLDQYKELLSNFKKSA